MRRGGHPILGAIVGFLLFLFIAIDLVLFGVLSTYSNVVTIIALSGIVVGILWGWWSPFRRGRVRPQRSMDAMPPPASNTMADAPPPPA